MDGALRTGRARWLNLLAAFALGLSLAASASWAGQLTGVVNVNTASIEELQLLPGIGEARARALIAARQERGGFEDVEDLLEVKGIGARGLERLRPFVRTAGRTTASIE